jgi:putative acetyltransferase
MEQAPLVIRPEQPGDAEAIRRVNDLAFGREGEAQLVDRLRRSNGFVPALSLVAEAGGQVAGHILFTKVHIIGSGGGRYETLALAPVAVLPARQRQGIGERLVRRGLADAGQLGYRSVVVLGHPAYYPRFGFRPAGQWGIKAPFPVSPDAFMALELVPGGLAGAPGTVQYPAGFAGV